MRLKCAGVCVVRDLWQTGGGGVGGVEGKIWWTLGTELGWTMIAASPFCGKLNCSWDVLQLHYVHFVFII